MKNETLSSHVKDYYQAQKLAPEKLENLLAQASKHRSIQAETEIHPSVVTINRKWFLPRHYVIAASLLFCFIVVYQFIYINSLSPEQIGQRVAQEIALNHNKQLAVEFLGNNLRYLRNEMYKLDFNLVASEKMTPANFTIVGARYCSIQGQLAAQIKLVDKQGRRYTLYQTYLSDTLKSLPTAEYTVNGIAIQQWREQDIFFGLAGATS